MRPGDTQGVWSYPTAILFYVAFFAILTSQLGLPSSISRILPEYFTCGNAPDSRRHLQRCQPRYSRQRQPHRATLHYLVLRGIVQTFFTREPLFGLQLRKKIYSYHRFFGKYFSLTTRPKNKPFPIRYRFHRRPGSCANR
jgi:hypothetical protein